MERKLRRLPAHQTPLGPKTTLARVSVIVFWTVKITTVKQFVILENACHVSWQSRLSLVVLVERYVAKWFNMLNCQRKVPNSFKPLSQNICFTVTLSIF